MRKKLTFLNRNDEIKKIREFMTSFQKLHAKDYLIECITDKKIQNWNRLRPPLSIFRDIFFISK